MAERLKKRCPRRWFSVFIVIICLRLSLQTSISFRSIPEALGIFFSEIPILRSIKIPSFTTVQRWTAALGYFKIKRPKEKSDDWQVIIDASVQVGPHKCLTVVGCKGSNIKPGRALKLQDLEPLEVRILKTVNGSVVKEVLDSVKEKVGHIQVICSDEGSDILSGIKSFKEENSKTIHIPDVAHKMANLLSYHLKDDITWQNLCTQSSQSKTKVQQTTLAAIASPAQRSKARFMNVDVLVEWSQKVLCLLDNLDDFTDLGKSIDLDVKLLEEQFSWLREYRGVIQHYGRLIQVTATARHLVRTMGVCSTMLDKFEEIAFGLDLNLKECAFVGKVIDFLQEQVSKTADIGTFIGSSEILESFFGTFKNMEGDQCKSGFTGLTLSAHAHIGTFDEDMVIAALSSTKTKEVNEWIKSQVGSTVQSKRKKIFNFVERTFKNLLVQKPSGGLEGDVVGF